MKMLDINGTLKAQVVSRLIFVMLIVILGVGVLLPILEEVIAGAGLTGMSAIVVSYFGVIIAVGIMVYTALHLKSILHLKSYFCT